nr:unnamed protein product [Callosobruchus chinensis]
MQDSLEDYIKISKNSGADVPVAINKSIQITAQRKVECDRRAQKIVEFSIEGKLIPEIFTKCLPYINRSHYQDIVEERAITKLCGYSVCGRRIPDMPKKQYFISMKNNKVYDITDRKNYCSNFCYKASLHIKKQIDDSPLWLRQLDDIPEYQLMETCEGGLPREYIDQGIAKPVADMSFTSVSAFTDIGLKDLVENEKGVKEDTVKRSKRKKISNLHKTMQTINENSEQLEDQENIEQISPSSSAQQYVPRKMENIHNHGLPVIEETEEKLEETAEISSKAKKLKKKSSKGTKIDIEALLKRLVNDWLTLDTYIFLYGEPKVKEILNEKKLSDYFETLNVAGLERNQQAKYMNICQKLQLQDMADEKFDNALLGNTKLMPIPDYKKLKEETKELDLKVKSFYTGVLHEKEDPNFHAANQKTESDTVEEVSPTFLPLVDISSQNALRRKVFLTSISKWMQQLLQALRVTSYTTVLSDLQNLVKTFHLKADNIVFKPVAWNYIAIVLLNILAIRDEDIKHILEEKSSQEFINQQLDLLPNKNESITEIMKNVRNIDLFIENYISSR